MRRDDLSGAIGIMHATALGAVMWIIVAAVYWLFAT